MFLGPCRDPAMVTQKLQLSCNYAPINVKPVGKAVHGVEV